jgi:hypothetical protein
VYFPLKVGRYNHHIQKLQSISWCYWFFFILQFTQGLYLEPLLQLFFFFVMDFFEIGSLELFAWVCFEKWSSWSLPPENLGLVVWAPGTKLVTDSSNVLQLNYYLLRCYVHFKFEFSQHLPSYKNHIVKINCSSHLIHYSTP